MRFGWWVLVAICLALVALVFVLRDDHATPPDPSTLAVVTTMPVPTTQAEPELFLSEPSAGLLKVVSPMRPIGPVKVPGPPTPEQQPQIDRDLQLNANLMALPGVSGIEFPDDFTLLITYEEGQTSANKHQDVIHILNKYGK
jgi:hypothetical protein